MLVEIKEVDNGWILTSKEAGEEGQEGSVSYVYQIQDEGRDMRESECVAFMELLYNLKDLIGPTQDKWSKHNLTVSIEEGKNYVEETSEETD